VASNERMMPGCIVGTHIAITPKPKGDADFSALREIHILFNVLLSEIAPNVSITLI
jgi:hypothetical protein